ncbi:hypothetical protein AXF42_Ash015737 [Apostasia shenzhenica]|uniref:Uncharacterized protein n=1 Tax=Apostasia shenzhenica TaxID=1088818 RepID=A0A2H9ZU79_9ASPA|nr:hypothetical protein AXF42_Ash015737 [Apostasia shenzhenica]
MPEEFQEAEVLWPDDVLVGEASGASSARRNEKILSFEPRDDRQKRKQYSSPISIPRKPAAGDRRRPWTLVLGYADVGVTNERGEEERECGETVRERSAIMIPPHVLASRRLPGEICFSPFGAGVRWREMSHLRDAVLRLTGFLES